jgi:phosphatidylglycerol lysyltransferase
LPNHDVASNDNELLRAHGGEAMSFHALDEGVRVWRHPQGLVGYVDTGSAWVTDGAPIAAANHRAQVARALVDEARRAARRVCFCAVEADDATDELSSLAVGSQAYWNPQSWAEKLGLSTSRSLREQLRRARAKQVRIRRLEPSELLAGSPAAAAIESLNQRWLESHGAPPLKFFLDVRFSSRVEERRVYAAQVGSQLVGVLGAVPIYARTGWFIRDIVREADAPNGTAELLFDAALKDAANDGSTYVTSGLVPLAGGVDWPLSAVKRVSHHVYDFVGLRRFREKLRPDGWQPIFLRHPRGQSALLTIWDALAAVTGQSPITWLFNAHRAGKEIAMDFRPLSPTGSMPIP